MKISEIFSRTKEADASLDFGSEVTKFPTRSRNFNPDDLVRREVDIEGLPKPDGCNCSEVLAKHGITVPEEVKAKMRSYLPGTHGLGKSYKDVLPTPVEKLVDTSNPNGEKYKTVERPEEGRGTVYNRFLFNSIKGLIEKGDGKAISDIIGGSTGDKAEDAARLLEHHYRHGELAGMHPDDPENPNDPNNMGISEDMYQAFKTHRQIKKGPGASPAPQNNRAESKYDIPTTNCSVCDQHWKAYDDGIDNYRKKVSSPLPGEGNAEQTNSEISSKVYEDWSDRKKPSRKEEPELSSLHKTLDEWNSHQKSHHNISLKGADPRIPVRVDTTGSPGERNPDVEQIYKEVTRTTGGWGYKRQPQIPLEDFLHEEENVHRFEPYDPTKETRTQYTQRSRGEYDVLKTDIENQAPDVTSYRPRVLPRAINPDTGKPYGALSVGLVPKLDEKGNTVPRKNRSIVKEYKYDSNGKAVPTGNLVPYEWESDETQLEKRRIPGLKPRTIVDMPGGSAIGHPARDESAKYIVERNKSKAVQNYSIADDPRAGKYEDIISSERPEIVKNIPGLDIVPRQHAYLFQKAGIEPDVAAVREYHRQRARYENQPTHRAVDTGVQSFTETKMKPKGQRGIVKEMVDGKVNELDYDTEYKRLFGGADDSGKYVPGVHEQEAEKLYPNTGEGAKTAPIAQIRHVENMKKQWHKKHSVELEAPDEWGNMRPTGQFVPKYVKNLSEPETTTRDIGTFRNEPIPASERIPEPKFMKDLAERNYSKSYNEALSKAYPQASSPQEAQQMLADEHANVVKRMEQVKAESRIPGNRRTIMSSKENEMPQFIFNSNKKEAIDLSSVAHGIEHAVNWIGNQGKETWDSMQHPMRAVDNFNQKWEKAYQNGTLGEHGNPEYYTNAPRSEELHAAMGYGATAVGTGLGVKKTINTLKDKLNQRTVDKQTHDRRKNVWDSLGEADREHMVNTFGRQVNPYHPAHDPSSDYGHNTNKRTSSVIELLSDKLAAATKKPCDNCGKKCKDKEECKANQIQAKRDRAAENAYND